jgi:hypothetical protein
MPISELPKQLRNMYQGYAKFLLGDLVSNTPSVILVPAPDPRHSGHKVRKSLNPKWYLGLYNNAPYCKRQRVLDALTRIANGNDKRFRSRPFRYDATVRDLITAFFTEGLEDYGIPPSNHVREFFGLSPLEETLEQPYTEQRPPAHQDIDDWPF